MSILYALEHRRGRHSPAVGGHTDLARDGTWRYRSRGMTLRGRFIPERAVALFLDVDGTLLELAASPDAVRVPAA